LVNVYCNGVDILELLSSAVLEHIKECSEITFEMMDDKERDYDPD
jgi:hypothetical protein